jgi:hypothetical protein
MMLRQEPLLRRVRSAPDWRAVRELRFRTLHASGEIAPAAARAFTDAFDESVNTSTYLLAVRDRVIGTTRGSLSAPRLRAPLPSERVFARELRAAFGGEAVLVEASLTFLDTEARGDPQDALLRLFKVHAWRCAAENADALVVAVRDTQIGFYRRRFDMEILSGAERWPGMSTPRVLMGLPWREHAADLLRRLPVLAASADEETAMKIMGSDP